MKPKGLIRLVYRYGYYVAKLLWWATRPTVHAAGVAVIHQNQVLLVRLTYGDLNRWQLPGGHVGRTESAKQAALRETAEEVGIVLDDATFVDQLDVTRDYKRALVDIFYATVDQPVAHADEVEIKEAAWFDRAKLPANMGSKTRRVIEQAFMAASDL